uniref:Uncharacterized protein n=1 Tax=Setaria italica TaxID=4555 RepID=K3XZX6_SETIT
MSAAAAERNAARGGGAGGCASDIRGGCFGVADRQRCGARRRSEHRESQPWTYLIYRPGLEYYEPLDRQAAATIRSDAAASLDQATAQFLFFEGGRPNYLSEPIRRLLLRPVLGEYCNGLSFLLTDLCQIATSPRL